MKIKESFIERYPLLDEDELIEEIFQCGKITELPTEEILIDLDQKIDSFPLLLDGSIKIIREDTEGKEIFLYYVESGNICAATISCCLIEGKSSIRAIVEEDSKFILIPIEYMDKWMQQYKSWRTFIFQAFSNRFNDMLGAIDQLAFKKMDERILNYLTETAQLNDSDTVHVSHQKVAFDLNTSREVVSRILKQLENEGHLKMGRGQIKLL